MKNINRKNSTKKANELANKFITKSIFDMSNVDLEDERKQAKKFATICVDEILNDTPNINDEKRLNHEYWEEVKRQITLL